MVLISTLGISALNMIKKEEKPKRSHQIFFVKSLHEMVTPPFKIIEYLQQNF